MDCAEPTVVPPVILDLCTVTIMHRFSSPAWWKALVAHVSAEISDDDAFDKVVRLEVSSPRSSPFNQCRSRSPQTGQAILLVPSGLGVSRSATGTRSLEQFGRRYLRIKTRRRVTRDGGVSVLVV